MMDFAEIKRYYRAALPEMFEAYSKTCDMRSDPYALNFTSHMTPIENAVWIDIRSEPIVMFPQVPVLKYFFDFANPFLKVAIECDGKNYHNPEKDAIRDAALAGDGWTIYRIPGWKCNRILQSPFDLMCDLQGEIYDDDEIADKVRDAAKEWFLNTSTGIVKAIAYQYFGHETPFDDLACMALDAHRSTPGLNESRRVVEKIVSTSHELEKDAIPTYRERILKRLAR